MRAADGHALSYSAVVRALLVVNPQATTTTPAGRDVLAHALASDVKLEIIETWKPGLILTPNVSWPELRLRDYVTLYQPQPVRIAGQVVRHRYRAP